MAADLFSANVPPGRLSLSISMLSCFIFRCRWEFASTLFDKKYLHVDIFQQRRKGRWNSMTPLKRLLWLYIFITDIIFPVVSCGPFQLAYSLLYPSCMILTRYAKRNFSAFPTIFKRHRQQFLQERAYLNSIFSSSSIIFAKKNCA